MLPKKVITYASGMTKNLSNFRSVIQNSSTAIYANHKVKPLIFTHLFPAGDPCVPKEDIKRTRRGPMVILTNILSFLDLKEEKFRIWDFLGILHYFFVERVQDLCQASKLVSGHSSV